MQKLFLFALIFTLFIYTALGILSTEEVVIRQKFNSWVKQHKKSYASESEYLQRYRVYRSNLKYVAHHNSQNLGFTLEMNKFADLTSKEFGKLYLSAKINANDIPKSKNALTYDRLPDADDEVDWRNKGAVTDIKNQGQCGSCWAFSTAAAIEGAWFLKNGVLDSYSPQQLIDCSGEYGNYGCNGGLIDTSFQYIIDNKGINTWASYPYEALTKTCRFNNSTVGARISSFVDIDKTETALQYAVKNIGPISGALDASHTSFQLYKSGIYYEPSCNPTQLDHGTNIIGYGQQGKDQYYIIKNMWGTDWGMQGYALMARNRGNNCGLATMASYPVV